MLPSPPSRWPLDPADARPPSRTSAEQRNRLAGELQWIVADGVKLMVRRAEAGLRSGAGPAAVVAALEAVGHEGREALDEVRRVARVLRIDEPADASDGPSPGPSSRPSPDAAQGPRPGATGTGAGGRQGGRHPEPEDALMVGLLCLPGVVVAAQSSARPVIGVPAAAVPLVPLLWRRSAPVASAWAVSVVVLAALGVAELRTISLALALLVTVAVLALYAREEVAWTGLAAGVGAVTVSELAWFGVPGLPPGGAAGAVSDAVLIERLDKTALAAMVLAVLPVPAVWELARAVRRRRERRSVTQEAEQLAAVHRAELERRLAVAERRRIARDLHDVVAHSLTVMIAQADGGTFAARTNPAAGVGALEVVVKAGRTVLAELDRLVGLLRPQSPAYPDLPEWTSGGWVGGGDAGSDGDRGEARQGKDAVDRSGLAALPGLVEAVRAGGLDVTYTCSGTPVPVSAGVGLAVYRIVQESLTNVLKHAGPVARAEVRLAWESAWLAVEVRDNGRGAGGLVTSDGRGQGVAGMRERAEAYGGRLMAGPFPGGFAVRAQLPVGRGVGIVGAVVATSADRGPAAVGMTGDLRPGVSADPRNRPARRRSEPAHVRKVDPMTSTSAPQYRRAYLRQAPVPASAALLRAEGLVKTYGSGPTAVHALAGVDVAVPAGRFTAIMGPSGSGKSTLLHCLAALDTPTAGRVWIGDTEVTGMGDEALTRLRRAQVGFVFQSFNLLPALTALQNILMPCELAGLRPDQEWLGYLVDVLGLADRLDHLPGALSGGQQQRVAIARALLSRPTVVVADEPTGNLDSTTGAEVLAMLRTSVHELGQTVVMVTHDPAAAAYTDTVLLLADGRLRGVIEDPSVEGVLTAMSALATGQVL